MSLTTLESAKEYSWITDTSQDAIIESLILSFDSFIEKSIWVIEQKAIDEEITLCEIYSNWSFYLSNKPITVLNSINWIAYTWVLNTDYKIVWNKLIVNDVSDYLTDLKFWSITINYTAWYSPVPADVTLAVNRMIAWELNKQGWESLKSYKMWPRSYSFAWEWDLSADQVASSSFAILNNYKTFRC